MVLGPAEQRVVKCSVKPLGWWFGTADRGYGTGTGSLGGCHSRVDGGVVACPHERDVLMAENKGETQAVVGSSKSKQGR